MLTWTNSSHCFTVSYTDAKSIYTWRRNPAIWCRIRIGRKDHVRWRHNNAYATDRTRATDIGSFGLV